jgi:hypothetical protein
VGRLLRHNPQSKIEFAAILPRFPRSLVGRILWSGTCAYLRYDWLCYPCPSSGLGQSAVHLLPGFVSRGHAFVHVPLGPTLSPLPPCVSCAWEPLLLLDQRLRPSTVPSTLSQLWLSPTLGAAGRCRSSSVALTLGRAAWMSGRFHWFTCAFPDLFAGMLCSPLGFPLRLTPWLRSGFFRGGPGSGGPRRGGPR